MLLGNTNINKDCGNIDLSSGLIAHYLFNNNSDDLLSNNGGSVVGAVKFQGDSMELSAGYTYINTRNFNLQTFTYSFHVEFDKTSDFRFFGEDNTSSGNSTDTGTVFTYNASTGKFRLRIKNGRSLNFGQIYIDADMIESGKMHHYIVESSAENDMTYLFIDNVLVGQAARPHVIKYNAFRGRSSNLLIGASYYTGISCKGRISNFRIYDQSLSTLHKTALFKETYYPMPLPLPTINGLIAHYPLAGTGEDVIGNRDGVERKMTYTNDSEFGNVAKFNGRNSYYSLRSFGQLNKFTISTWFYTDGSGRYDHLLTANNQRDFAFKFYESQSTFYVYTRATGSLIAPYGCVQLNKFNNLIMTADGITLRLLLNGVEVLNRPFTRALPDTTFTIGKWASEYSVGKQRSLRLYNRDITTQEAVDIYRYEKNFRNLDIDNNLVAYYPLANNSENNYYCEWDGRDIGGVTYDGNNFVGNGTNAYIDLTSALSNINMSNAFAISIWFKYPTNGTGYILSLGTIKGRDVLLVTKDKIYKYLEPEHVTFPQPLNDDKFHNLIFIHKGNERYKILLDDVMLDDNWFSDITLGSSPKFYIGTDKSDAQVASNFTNAIISKIRIYSDELTDVRANIIYKTEREIK